MLVSEVHWHSMMWYLHNYTVTLHRIRSYVIKNSCYVQIHQVTYYFRKLRRVKWPLWIIKTWHGRFAFYNDMRQQTKNFCKTYQINLGEHCLSKGKVPIDPVVSPLLGDNLLHPWLRRFIGFNYSNTGTCSFIKVKTWLYTPGLNTNIYKNKEYPIHLSFIPLFIFIARLNIHVQFIKNILIHLLVLPSNVCKTVCYLLLNDKKLDQHNVKCTVYSNHWTFE